jgi:hypothetical protein
MERKLHELTNLVEKLNDRITKARENNTISTIETDIILQLLRECYVVTEQLKSSESSPEKYKSPYVAPVVQVIQESREEQPEKTEEFTPTRTPEQTVPVTDIHSKNDEVVTSQPEPHNEVVFPQPQPQDEVVTPQSEPQKEVVIPQQPPQDEADTPQSEPQNEMIIPQPESKNEVVVPQSKPIEEVKAPPQEPEQQTMLPIEEIPVMSFPKVEVPQDKEPQQEADKEENSTTNIYSAVGSIATNTPSDKQTHAPPTNQNTQSGSFSQMQNTTPPMKTTRQTGDLFGGQTIADKLKNETPSLIDKINEGRADQTLAHKMQLKPINDLKTAIGINEKFQFVNDLFEGRIDLYNDAISKLNGCGSESNANSIMEEYMSAHKWNTSNEAYIKLRTFITRRYL